MTETNYTNKYELAHDGSHKTRTDILVRTYMNWHMTLRLVRTNTNLHTTLRLVRGKSQLKSSHVGHIRYISGIRSFSSAIFSTAFHKFPDNMNLVPPQQPIDWNHSPQDITRLTQESIDADRILLDSIATLGHKDCNYDSVSTAPLILSIFILTSLIRFS